MWWVLLPLVAGMLQRGADLDSFRMAVNPAFSRSPGAFRIVVLVEPDPENRWLVFRADSTEYYRSSTTQLNGAAAPRRHMMIFEGLPAGQYVIQAVLERSDGGRLRREFTVKVIGRPGYR